MNRTTLWRAVPQVGLFAFLLTSCSDGTTDPGEFERLPETPLQCSIPSDLLFRGSFKDGIPALTNPPLVRAGDPEMGYLGMDDRVVGLELPSGPIAIPLNIFWWHEVVNLDGYRQGIAITHCPLTGSSMAFDRAPVSGAEFGVSGLLFKNNLLMYDRDTHESLWPQMFRGARCGVRDGVELPMFPVIEMTWAGWRALHPRTMVVSENTGFDRDYREYPYGDYEDIDNSLTIFPATLDPRRPPKERVLGVPLGSGGLAFPFGLLEEVGDIVSLPVPFEGGDLVVFWNRFRQAAMAFTPIVNQERLTFSVDQGRILDDQTGSVWRVNGIAVEGPLAGQRLRPKAEAFVAFWFAWPEFFPDIKIWTEIGDD